MWKMQVEAECASAGSFGVRGVPARLLAILGVLLCVLIAPGDAAEPNAKNVLVVFSSFGRNTAWLDKVEPPIRARVAVPITFYEACIEEGPDAEGDSYRQSVAEAFRRRYAGKKLVSDAGAGFDVEEAKKNRGLGLVSMQERIHLVHGSFSVESKPWQGTRIIAAVPILAEGEWSEELNGRAELAER